MKAARSDIHTWIIPADAGSTTPAAPNWSHQQDHPRGCGEHLGPSGKDRVKLGSSPRMRGALECKSLGSANHRIIPADAGST